MASRAVLRGFSAQPWSAAVPRSHKCDVCVVGGGLAGAFTALALSRGGARVTLLEQHTSPTHTRGSSHGDGRIFRFAYPDREYVSLAQRAKVMWRELEAESGRELLSFNRGGLDIGQASHPRIRALIEMLESQRVPHEVLGPERAAKRFPQFRLSTGEVAIYQQDAAVARADACIDACWRALCESPKVFAAAGDSYSHVDGLGDMLRPLEVHTAAGSRIQAEKVVFAMGSWTMPLLESLGLDVPLWGTEERAVYFPVRDGCDVSHSAQHMPVFIPHVEHNLALELSGTGHESGNDWGYYGIPTVDIPGVKVCAHHTGKVFQDPSRRPSKVDPEASEKRNQEIYGACADLIGRMFPHLEPEPCYSTYCLYTSTKDHHFLVDVHPRDNRAGFVGGLSGHGFKFGPALGEVVAQMITSGKSTAEDPNTAIWSLQRFRSDS